MPWQEVKTVSLRSEFVLLALGDSVPFSELCRRFGISRKTGYKWLERYRQTGQAGLEDRSRRPRRSPGKVSADIETAILACRARHPYWGGRKLRRILEDEGYSDLPAPSTITAILRRHDKLLSPTPPAAASSRFEHPFPNDLWQMDFKGHFQTGPQRCHPLTVLDDHSRFSLCLKACADERTETVRDALTTTFRRYGVPRRMTMDNGAPWGGGGHSRHSQLSVWLIEQGITVGYSRPYHPQTQGKDERFHRTMEVELLGRRGFDSLAACQRAFQRWREQYNHLRPHEALAMQTPASRYLASERPYQEKRPPYAYGDIDHVRRVSRDQSACFKGYRVQVGLPFVGRQIAIRPTQEDGIFTLHFCHQRIGRIDLRELVRVR